MSREPTSSPARWSRRAVADVPERCMPLMSRGGAPMEPILSSESAMLGSRPLRSAGQRDMPDVEFALVAEAGPLEAQALLLVESLRRFGGRGADAPGTVASPPPAPRPARATIPAP